MYIRRSYRSSYISTRSTNGRRFRFFHLSPPVVPVHVFITGGIMMQKTKSGRFNKSSDQKNLMLVLRMTESEKTVLKEMASAAGMTISEFVRRRSLGTPVITKETSALIRELRRQGGLIKHVWLETGKVSNDALRAISIITSVIKKLANGG